jgi:transposase
VAEAALQNILTQYELIDRQKQETEMLMQELLLKVPNASKLMDIKGIGMVTAAVIVSEIGDIRRFRDPRQIQKMAGLNLRENSSGKHKGKTTISKRGRKRLREGLFRAMITMLATNQEFRVLHRRNLTRENNPLTKMESVIALCGKLIRVIFAILTKGNDYDAKKMLDDMNRSMKAA